MVGCIIIRSPKSLLSWMVDLLHCYSFSVVFERTPLNRLTVALLLLWGLLFYHLPAVFCALADQA